MSETREQRLEAALRAILEAAEMQNFGGWGVWVESVCRVRNL